MDSEVIGVGESQCPSAAAVYGIRWKNGNGRDRKMVMGPASIKLDDARNVARQRLSEVAAERAARCTSERTAQAVSLRVRAKLIWESHTTKAVQNV